MNRLQTINSQFEKQATASLNPTLSVWDSLGYDKYLRPEFVNKRIALNKMMNKMKPDIVQYWDNAELPPFFVDNIKQIGINGLRIKDFGGCGMNHIEAGAMSYELAKVDASLATFYLVHNGIGTAVIDELGDNE
jgi:glutaryl-CoA dehydrogenase